MPRYHRLGEMPAQRHIQFRKPDGSLYAEQLFSTHGFSGPIALMYHINMPTEVMGWEDMGQIAPEFLTDEALRHRHFVTGRMQPKGDAISGRVPLMGNADVIWNNAWIAEQMVDFFKNAEADEIHFVHDGSGVLETMFGEVPFRPGDYLVIPRGTILKIRYDKLPVMPAIALFGFGWGGNYSLLQATAADAFGSRALGRVMGALTVLDAGGGALGPWVSSLLYDRYGSYSSAFGLVCVLIAVSILLAASLRIRPSRGVGTAVTAA